MTELIGQESVWKECLQQLDKPSHLFLTGPAGCGKTIMMRSFLQLYATEKKRPLSHLWGYHSTDECLLLGPEQDRGIQTIRGQVSLFIRQMAAQEDIYRWVVIDDVDSFPHISQQALRRPMESYSHITRFLFIGSSEEDLINALRSRCIHIKMNTVDILQERPALLRYIDMPLSGIEQLTEEMWNWIMSLSGGNISDLIRLLRLIRDVHHYQQKPLTSSLVRTLCSAPFYLHFIPLLTAMTQRNIPQAIQHLIQIWKRGYMYEDVLESFQQINQLFGDSDLGNNVLIHRFLIQAWVSYCKGNTSLLALQHTLYRVISAPTSLPPASLPPTSLPPVLPLSCGNECVDKSTILFKSV
jgi:replication factor C subunit 2/4